MAGYYLKVDLFSLPFWLQPQNKRLFGLLIVTIILFIMGFYSATDPAYLGHDRALHAGDWLGGGVCHRLTERSFMINGRQFPLCARCTGMYLGVAVAFVVVFLAGRIRWTDLPSPPILIVLVGFIGVMGVDGVNSYTHFFANFPHLYEPRNWLRLVTGVGTGLAMGLFAFPILAQTLWANGPNRRMVINFREFGLILAVAATAVLLLLSNQPTISYVLALVSVGGLLLILTSLNAILWMTLLKKDGLATRWRETAVPLIISGLLALGQLSVLSAVRIYFTGTITGIPGL